MSDDGRGRRRRVYGRKSTGNQTSTTTDKPIVEPPLLPFGYLQMPLVAMHQYNQLPHPVFVYWDNSNIFLRTQYYSSKVNKYKDGVMDIQCRINTKKLIEAVLGGRAVSRRNAYGHMTKETKVELEKAGFVVFMPDSSMADKEVDIQLSVDATEDILEHQCLLRGRGQVNAQHNGTLILLSGDKSMKPLIKFARKHRWDVEVWTYDDSFAGALRFEAERHENGSIMGRKPLEDFFHKFVFYEDKFPEELDDRSILVRFSDSGALFNKQSTETQTVVSRIVTIEAKSIFRLPLACKQKEIDTTRGSEETVIAIVLALDDRKLTKPLYNFQLDILDKLHEFERNLKCRLDMLQSTGLAISNFDTEIDAGQILNLFRPFGTIEAFQLKKDPLSGKSVGDDVAILYFRDESETTEALNNVDESMFDVSRHKPVIGIQSRDVYITRFGVTSASEVRRPPAGFRSDRLNIPPRISTSTTGSQQILNPGGDGGPGPSTSNKIQQHPQYRTRFCTREVCDKSTCVRAHSNEEIRCFYCSGNHIANACKEHKAKK